MAVFVLEKSAFSLLVALDVNDVYAALCLLPYIDE